MIKRFSAAVSGNVEFSILIATNSGREEIKSTEIKYNVRVCIHQLLPRVAALSSMHARL